MFLGLINETREGLTGAWSLLDPSLPGLISNILTYQPQMGFDFVVDVIEFFLPVMTRRGSIHVLVFPRVEKLFIDIPDCTAKRTQTVFGEFLPTRHY